MKLHQLLLVADFDRWGRAVLRRVIDIPGTEVDRIGVCWAARMWAVWIKVVSCGWALQNDWAHGR